jgi:hypothetical protein
LDPAYQVNMYGVKKLAENKLQTLVNAMLSNDKVGSVQV